MKKFFAAIIIFVIGMASFALAGEQTAGGWGLNCQAGNLTCTSTGRNIGCQATAGDSNVRTECTSHWGDDGWVFCATYDTAGNRTNEYSDKCP